MKLLVFVSLVLTLHGCGRHVTTNTNYQAVHRDGYVYQRLNDGEYVVAAINDKELKKALAEIGCGSTEVCLVEREGEYYSVQQRHSK